MKALSALRQFFRPNEPTIALPDSPFVVVDRDDAIKRLKLDERAAENGANEFPPSDALEFDPVEASIVAEIGEYLHRAQVNATNNHDTYARRLAELSLLRELSSITGSSKSALGDYDASIIEWKDSLTEAEDAIRESYAELADFKNAHGLRNRPAHTTLPLRFLWMSLLFSLLIESGLNTAFLAGNDEFGIAGGFFVAISVAALNIGLSAAFGRKWWPYVFHADGSKRALAIVGSIVFAALILTINLVMGHYRDARIMGVADPEKVALSMFVDGPISFESTNSYALLIVGLVFAGFSILAGFKMDDPYPGYGPIFRRHSERCDNYTEDVAAALADLKRIRDEGITDATAIRDQLRAQFQERGQILAARETHRLKFEKHQIYLEGVGNSLLDHYRALNHKARTTAPPKHFGEKWILSKLELPAVPDEPSIEKEVEAAQHALDEAIAAIADAYTRAIHSFNSLDSIKRSLKNG